MKTLEELIHEIIKVGSDLKTLHGLHSEPTIVNPPITQQALDKMLAVIPFTPPPSLLELLKLHDGIENIYWVDGALIPSSYYTISPLWAEPEDNPTWFYFMVSENCSWDGVVFDKATQGADGEMEVIEVTSRGEDVRWPSSYAFLEGYLKRLERWIAEAKADLVGIDDDDD